LQIPLLLPIAASNSAAFFANPRCLRFTSPLLISSKVGKRSKALPRFSVYGLDWMLHNTLGWTLSSLVLKSSYIWIGLPPPFLGTLDSGQSVPFPLYILCLLHQQGGAGCFDWVTQSETARMTRIFWQF
jgi:hypothetical protein